MRRIVIVVHKLPRRRPITTVWSNTVHAKKIRAMHWGNKGVGRLRPIGEKGQRMR